MSQGKQIAAPQKLVRVAAQQGKRLYAVNRDGTVSLIR